MIVPPDVLRGALPEEQSHFPALGPNVNGLLVWPKIPCSYWSFTGMLSVIPESTIMPPLGLLTLAALCPKSWNLRLIDCAFQEVTDSDLQWAHVVLVSAMQVQRVDTHSILRRARALGVRTMIGGPYASSQPEILLPLADHVVVGEPDEVFGEIAHQLETGAAQHLYRIEQKPDVRRTPPPRFDLLELGRYASMAVQFSRLSLPVRVLRHHHYLWAAPSDQDTGPGPGRPRSTQSLGMAEASLCGGRQLHRQSQNGARTGA